MNRRIHVSVESIMVILLMIIFAIAISVLIYNGSITYRNIIDNKNQEENSRIALSYINMRIKQNDISGNISVQEDSYEGSDVLTILHHDEEDGLMSHIYYLDGYLWECYTDGPLDHNLSTEVIAIDGMNFEMAEDGQWLSATLNYKNNKDDIPLTQLTTLRTHTIN